MGCRNNSASCCASTAIPGAASPMLAGAFTRAARSLCHRIVAALQPVFLVAAASEAVASC